MSSLRLILVSLLHHWRMNLAVAAGVAAGSAVLTGALLVGDSMRASLRRLTLDRLQSVDEVLLTERFFREQLADEIANGPGFDEFFTDAVPVVMLTAGVESTAEDDRRRVNRVNLIGCDERFWKLGSAGPYNLDRRQIVLNRPLADRLGVGKKDRVRLHLPDVRTVPGESLLGRKRDPGKSPPMLTVVDVLEEDDGKDMGRFSLRASQQLPLNAYVSLAGLQNRLKRPGRVNAVLVAGQHDAGDLTPESRVLKDGHRRLKALLRPEPADYGIRIAENVPAVPPAARDAVPPDQHDRFRYINVTSERMLFDPEVEAAVRRALRDERFQPVLTYLANAIDRQRHETLPEKQGDDGPIIPYSTITAIDFADDEPLGPFLDLEGRPIGPLRDEHGPQIVLNSWAAEDLGVQQGEKVYVTYFEPESTHGQSAEPTGAFTVAAVAELAGPAADAGLTPIVPGVSDKDSIDLWEAPFTPFRKRLIRKKDDDYWRNHGLTPKAFVSLATGQRLWGSRFGQVTSFRVAPGERTTVESVREAIRRKLPSKRLGFAFRPVKQQGLAASAGATSFGVLFVMLSFFVIAAAMMLVALLFRLGIDRRWAELGILAAVGFRRRKVLLLLSTEGLLIAVLGSLAGVPAGIGYAAAMLWGLRHPGLWRAAVGTPFLQFHYTWTSLAIGFAAGVLVATAAVAWAVWRTRHLAPRQLLAGQVDGREWGVGSEEWGVGRRRAGVFVWIMLLAAVAISLATVNQSETARAGAFFGAGAMVLAAALIFTWIRLRQGTVFFGVIVGPAVAVGRGNLLRIARRNAARNPGRSTLTIGLVAAACFVIVAVSAFQLDPSGQVPTPDSGNGGFAVIVQSDRPIYHDLNTTGGRELLRFNEKASGLLRPCKTVAIRVNAGDDASCLNLYRPRQPRVLGVPPAMIDRGGFAWVGGDLGIRGFRDLGGGNPEVPKSPNPEIPKSPNPHLANNPWRLLNTRFDDEDDVPVVPAVIDKNTATYALHPRVGVGDTYDVTDGRGEKLRLKVVGLLSGSIFQGDLLIGEEAFLRHFPDVNGYRLLLVETPSKTTPKGIVQVRDALESSLGDYGASAETTGQRLSRLLTVQNTYLTTFQSLGGLGLLLGTFGLAAVQLRNVLERRGELALLRAAGFRRAALVKMVMLENGLLLLAGLGSGIVAALVAVLPHLLTSAASIPWGPLAFTLGSVAAVGLIAGLAAVRAVLRAPLLPALRHER